jgi:hypothetical protein
VHNEKALREKRFFSSKASFEASFRLRAKDLKLQTEGLAGKLPRTGLVMRP